MRLPPNLSEEELHAHVRERALAVINGTGTAEQFLRWIHDTVGHAGPEMYQDLVEMDCIPPLHDAGTGEWFTNSIEAQPLRNWVSASLPGLREVSNLSLCYLNGRTQSSSRRPALQGARIAA